MLSERDEEPAINHFQHTTPYLLSASIVINLPFSTSMEDSELLLFMWYSENIFHCRPGMHDTVGLIIYILPSSLKSGERSVGKGQFLSIITIEWKILSLYHINSNTPKILLWGL